MVFRFNLKQISILTVLFLAFFALAKYENWWLALGTLVCIFAWLAVGKLTTFCYKNLGATAYWKFGGFPAPSPILRFTFVWGCASLIMIVAIAITNAVREESANLAGPVVSFAWLLFPGVWVLDLLGYGNKPDTNELPKQPESE